MKKLVLISALLAGLVAAGRVIFHAMRAGGAISTVDQNQERLTQPPSSVHDELSMTNKAARGYRGQFNSLIQQLQEVARALRA
ncbi:MAG TPA: hypothetical protein VFI42_17700 [Thermomicrobiaceae bacterium]|nr:hypothetical protein [Thermomicrobiaceae bacterium]